MTELVMVAITEMKCENCPAAIHPGQQCQIASPQDIRIVCMTCFHALTS